MTPRERRVVRLGLATIGGAVFLLRLTPWGVRHVVHDWQDLSQQAGLLAHARTEVSRTPALRDSAVLMQRQLGALPAALLVGRTPRAGAADLARRVRAVAPRERAQLLRLETLRDSTRAGLIGRVTVRATLLTDIGGLGQLLSGLNGGDVVLVVRKIEVAVRDPDGLDRRPEVLRVRLTISAWYARKAGQPEAGRA